MQLWIRSQDKNVLRKIDNVYISQTLYQNGNGGYSIKYEGQYESIYTLGEYRTKERALEVLDEIQKLLKPTFKINYEYDDSQPIMNGEWLKSLKAESKIEELSWYVYEMPKE